MKYEVLDANDIADFGGMNKDLLTHYQAEAYDLLNQRGGVDEFQRTYLTEVIHLIKETLKNR